MELPAPIKIETIIHSVVSEPVSWPVDFNIRNNFDELLLCISRMIHSTLIYLCTTNVLQFFVADKKVMLAL